MKRTINTLSLCLLATTITLSSAQAQDNPKPNSWRNIVVKVTETYGNNQSRPLRGAKVTLGLASDDNSAEVTTRFPQTKTSGPRGAQFTRMPPSSMVGKYTVTVDPKPNDRTDSYSCKKRTKNFIHSTRGTTTQFNFTCLKKKASAPSVAAKTNTNSNNRGQCHKVRIQKQDGRRDATYATACMQANGRWVIEPFKY
jgi:hypothetical protein